MKKIYLNLSTILIIASQWISMNQLTAQNATLKENWFQANNTVHKILQDTARNRILIGGQFTNFNKPGKNFLVKTNSANAQVDLSNPSPDNIIQTSIDDGNGGVYVCGAFNNFQGVPRAKIARLDSTGNVTSFQLSGFSGYAVHAMFLDGGTLYIAGDFDAIGGQTRVGLAAVNAQTGALLPWTPALEFWDNVGFASIQFYAIQVIGNKVFLGGAFQGGYDTSSTFINRRALVAFDKQTGALSTWNANIGAGGQQVYCLNSWNDSLVVGGAFLSISGGIRNNLAIIDTISAGLSPFNAHFNNAVYSIYDNDSTFYVGGFFTQVNFSNSRTGIAEINKSTGNLTSFAPALLAQNTPIVRQFKKTGNELSICGRFNSINGDARGGFTTINLLTNALSSYIVNGGGIFPFEFNTFFEIGNDLYLGGSFSNFSPVVKPAVGVAAIDESTGDTLPFPLLSGNSSNGIIWDMAIHEDYLYVGGDFDHNQPLTLTSYKNLLRINLLTDSVDYSWRPQPNNAVFSVLPDSNYLFVGGFFSQLDTNNRNLVAKINLTNGTVEPFNPFNTPVGVNEVIFDLEKHGGNLFIGGTFIGLQTLVRENFAVVNANSGLLLPPTFNANGFVRTFNKHQGKLYIGGGFTEINGNIRSLGAAVDLNNFTLQTWNPNIQGFAIRAIEFYDTLVFIGGDFNPSPNSNSLGFRTATVSTGSFYPFNILTNGVVRAISNFNNKIYLGGAFTSINDVSRSRFAALDLSLQCNLPDVPTISASALSVCSPQDSVTLTITSGNLNDATHWAWYLGVSCIGTSSIDSGNTITVAYNFTGPSYTLSARGVGGCVANSHNNCSNITVQIIGNSAVISGNTSICQGESTTLTLSGAASQTWSGGLGSSNIITVSPTQPTTYTVTGVDTAGCNFTRDIFVNVYNNPDVNVTTTNADCNASNGTAKLSNNGDPIGSINYNGIDINALAAGNYDIEVTTVYGCSSTISFTIANNNAHDVTLNTNDVLCFGETTGNVNATVIGGTPPYSYNWGGANPLALGAGNYNVTVTDASGCIVSEVFEIEEPALLEASGSVTNEQVNDDGEINLTVSGGTPTYTFNWSNGATTQNISNLAPADYSVTITDANNCTLEQTYQVMEAPSGIQDLADKSFTFYPNPTKNQIIIKSQLPQTISIYNMLGKEVFKAQVQNSTVVDLSHFAAGVCVIRNGLSESYRLIKN